jgi:uncharacterized protein (TIGR02453 family)
MTYFNSGYIEFLEKLSENNKKSWFRGNKKWYELAVREPFKKLLDDLIPGIKKIDPEINMKSKDALFRINRDMRFSGNQSPYKTHMSAGFSRGGRKSQYAGFYLQIGRKHLVLGGGLPYLDRDVLRKIRIEIGYNLPAFSRIVSAKKFVDLYGTLLGETDYDLPKSFVSLSKEFPLIAKKQLYYSAFFQAEELLFDENLPTIILDHFQAGSELNMFLINAISNFSRPSIRHSGRKVLEF